NGGEGKSMHARKQFCKAIFGRTERRSKSRTTAWTRPCSVLLVVLATLTVAPLQGQTYRVIHDFMFTQDSAFPEFGVSMDNYGNLYGTTQNTVFKMSPRASGEWTFSTLYSFTGP